MTQTKRQSMIESTVNTASGFIVSYGLGWIVFPLFGFDATLIQIGWITIIYTLASVVRCYVVRRLFNGRIGK